MPPNKKKSGYPSPEDLLKGYETALNSHDTENLNPFIDKNAIFIFTDGTYIGIEQIKKACSDTWQYYKNEIYGIEDITWLVKTENTAACYYNIKWSADRNNKRQLFEGRGTTIFKKTNDGWKITHEHLSRQPEST